ncbi:hypothetical protein [Lysobacter gummosus]|uniref:hypothetical protein n=1 Tax=Lysobacter gummosus TaxID=262324 RepID=UPI00363122D4
MSHRACACLRSRCRRDRGNPQKRTPPAEAGARCRSQPIATGMRPPRLRPKRNDLRT